MQTPDDDLLRCVPVRVVAKWRNPALRVSLLAKHDKSVVVLFADIEGCTRRCEDLAPSQMNALTEFYFSRFFEIVEQAGGSVNEILGDGFMAIFEDGEHRKDVLAAAGAAVSIQREAAALNAQRAGDYEPVLVNIGIHAGNTFVGFTKFRTMAGERWTYTASGPVTNIAARLSALASGGAILVSDTVARMIGERFPLERLGPRKLKNVSQPVVVVRIVQGAG